MFALGLLVGFLVGLFVAERMVTPQREADEAKYQAALNLLNLSLKGCPMDEPRRN